MWGICQTPQGASQTFEQSSAIIIDLTLCRHRQVTKKEAEKVVRELGLVTFLDCSAITQAGLKTVFDEAIIAAIEPLKKSEDDKCSIL